MTEDEAREWIADNFGDKGAERMQRLAALVREASEQQNLIARSTLDAIWNRHILDSAQLISLAGDHPGSWLDIGTGAGFPGLVIAALTDREVIMVEPRKRRVEFLEYCCAALGLGDRARVTPAKVERVDVQADVISARAVASLDVLMTAAERCSTWNTLWLCPKGKSASQEIVTAQRTWHGRFHVERSVTSEESMIVVAKEVSRR